MQIEYIFSDSISRAQIQIFDPSRVYFTFVGMCLTRVCRMRAKLYVRILLNGIIEI